MITLACGYTAIDGQLNLIPEPITTLPPTTATAATANNYAAGSASSSSKKVFIVHGRDEGAKEAVAHFISDIGLEPIILAERANQGRTIIEKLERYGNPDFAIVLFTPDDVGALQNEQDRVKPRARQNVVLEYGFFAGVLGRDKVCALYKAEVELPSDIGGLGLVELDAGGGWRVGLFNELEVAKLDPNRKMLLANPKCWVTK